MFSWLGNSAGNHLIPAPTKSGIGCGRANSTMCGPFAGQDPRAGKTLNEEIGRELALEDQADEPRFEASIGATPFGDPPQMYFWAARSVGGQGGAGLESA